MQNQSSHHHHSSNSNHDGGGSGGIGGGGGGGGSSYSKTWELNQYELNRLPHEIIYDDRTIAVSPKVLQNELMCPICLDILKHTMTTKECLHRFCQECIITALRAGNKECPTCRKKLVSKRSLRPDPNFDAIIAKIYPNREEYDALHEKVLEKLNKKHLTAFVSGGSGGGGASSSSNTSVSASRARGVNSRAAIATNASSAHSNGIASGADATTASSSNGKGLKRTSTAAAAAALAAAAANSDDESDIESRTSTEQSSTTHYGYQTDADEIELVLKPHPTKETTLTSKRFLKTTSNATMNHLSKYLWTRLCVEVGGGGDAAQQQPPPATDSVAFASSEPEFQLFIHQKNAYQHLEAQLTLDQVIEQYWKQNRPIELFYYRSTSPKKTTATAAAAAAAAAALKHQPTHHLNDANSNSSTSSSNSSSVRSNTNSSSRK